MTGNAFHRRAGTAIPKWELFATLMAANLRCQESRCRAFGMNEGNLSKKFRLAGPGRCASIGEANGNADGIASRACLHHRDRRPIRGSPDCSIDRLLSRPIDRRAEELPGRRARTVLPCAFDARRATRPAGVNRLNAWIAPFAWKAGSGKRNGDAIDMNLLHCVCSDPMRAQARFREACVGGGAERGIVSGGPGCGGEGRFSR